MFYNPDKFTLIERVSFFILMLSAQDSDSTSERMHNKVSDKITELVEEGVTGIKEVQRRLEVFVNTQLCPELWKPCHTNRRYYPTKAVIRNKMYNACIRRRMNIIDHEVVNELLKEREGMHSCDNGILRIPTL